MKAIVKPITAIVVCMTLLTLTGCWDQKIYERIGFILQMGLELDQDGKLSYTVSIPVVAPDIEEKVEILSTSQNLLRESRERVRRVSGKTVEGGKTQHVYFSKQLAQKGIGNLMEIFLRNTENPLLANVIVVDESPRKMMEMSAKFKSKPRPAFYVNDLLVNARENSYIPETRISHFYIMKYSKTIDPITPMVRYNEKEIVIVGTALFSGDKMAGEIDAADTGMLLALMGKNKKINYMYHKQDPQESPADSKEGAAVFIKDSKRKVNISTDGKAPKIDIKLDFKASLDEYSEEHNLDDPEAKKKLEENIAKSMERDCMNLLKYMQKVGSDPIGIGEMVRSKHNSYWKSVEWKDVYKKASFDVEVKLNFEFYGAIN